MKNWSKATEKKALLDLIAGDTYFGDALNMAQYDIMCHNIDNDFPLLCGTIADPDELTRLKALIQAKEEEIGSAKQDLIEARNDHQAEVDHLKWTLDMLLLKIFSFNAANGSQILEINPNNLIYNNICDITRQDIIRLKFNNHIPWDDADLAFIMDQISKP